MTENLRGAAWMTLAMLTFTINDGLVKAASAELPLPQIILLRGLGITVALVAIAALRGMTLSGLSRRDRKLVVIRALAEAAGTWTFLTALVHMPIANVSAIMQALPLAVTLASLVVFRESVGWRRMTAIVVGFAGVMLIVRPGMEGFSRYAVLALISVACVTVRDLAARRLSPQVSSLSVSLAASIAVTSLGGVMMVGQAWTPVTGQSAALISGAVAMLIVGYMASVTAMRVGEIGFVAPFRYTSLLVSLLIGFAVWREWPDALTLYGAAIVVGTGIYTLWRERGVRAAAPRGLRVR